jgi:L-2-hydroxyglutarate oxidase LhgO
MTDTVDITIIGAGVIGLAVASEVARKGREIYLLEKNGTFGQEQSSRSSEVIHAGIYYSSEYLKTRLCLEGNRLIYELCETGGIPCIRCGKIFIATDNAEVEELEGLYNNGINNGLPLKRLSHSELLKLEPNVEGIAAFLSPTSGIMDSHALMRHFLNKARESGVQVAYKTKVNGIEKVPQGYKVLAEDPSGRTALTTRVLVNCAGLHSDSIAALAGIDIGEAGYRLHLTKGEYYSVSDGRNMVNSLVYPVPSPLGPGIHACLDIDRRLRLGPLFYYVDEIDYSIGSSRKSEFLQSTVMKSLPFIGPEDIEPESAGMMGTLYGEGEPVSDFIIRHELDRGLPGLINLIGIDSPGLTTSPAIAGYVSRIVDEILN